MSDRARAHQVVIRETLLEALASGERVARAELLRAAATRLELSAEQRKLRQDVAREMRRLLEEGVIVDAGPEVYLSRRAGATEE